MTLHRYTCTELTFLLATPTDSETSDNGVECIVRVEREQLIASKVSNRGKILAIVGPRAFLVLQSLIRRPVGWTLSLD